MRQSHARPAVSDDASTLNIMLRHCQLQPVGSGQLSSMQAGSDAYYAQQTLMEQHRTLMEQGFHSCNILTRFKPTWNEIRGAYVLPSDALLAKSSMRCPGDPWWPETTSIYDFIQGGLVVRRLDNGELFFPESERVLLVDIHQATPINYCPQAYQNYVAIKAARLFAPSVGVVIPAAAEDAAWAEFQKIEIAAEPVRNTNYDEVETLTTWWR